MNTVIARVIAIACYVVLAPFVMGFLDGVDRKLTARMQGRKGPSLLQPFYDLGKLFSKEFLSANRMQFLMIISYLIFMVFSGALFFGGFDLLLCFFALSTAAMFLILASTSTHSPYASQGCHREMMQMMSYEPMVLLTAIGFYLARGTFNVSELIQTETPIVAMTPGFFLGFVFILTIKFRKSPFDLSTSHHAHQEVIKGVTTEMVGMEYGLVTLAEWYENTFLLGVVGLFFVTSNPLSYIWSAAAVLLVFFFEILIDNTCARVKWQLMLKMAWAVTLICGGLNLFILEIIK